MRDFLYSQLQALYTAYLPDCVVHVPSIPCSCSGTLLSNTTLLKPLRTCKWQNLGARVHHPQYATITRRFQPSMTTDRTGNGDNPAKRILQSSTQSPTQDKRLQFLASCAIMRPSERSSIQRSHAKRKRLSRKLTNLPTSIHPHLLNLVESVQPDWKQASDADDALAMEHRIPRYMPATKSLLRNKLQPTDVDMVPTTFNSHGQLDRNAAPEQHSKTTQQLCPHKDTNIPNNNLSLNL